MRVHIYTYMFWSRARVLRVHIHAYIRRVHTRTYIRIYIYVAYTRVRIYAYIYTSRTHAYVYTQIYIRRVHTRTYIRIYTSRTYIRIYAYIYTYINTHIYVACIACGMWVLAWCGHIPVCFSTSAALPELIMPIGMTKPQECTNPYAVLRSEIRNLTPNSHFGQNEKAAQR